MASCFRFPGGGKILKFHHFLCHVCANLELVDMFCYLGDLLNIAEDADAAVEARIRIGWNKFRQLVPLLTNKDIS